MNAHLDVITSACDLLAQDESVSLDRLASHVRLSVSQLQRRFKAATGVTPKQYQQALRAQRLRAALDGETSVTTATWTRVMAATVGSTKNPRPFWA